MNPNVLKIKSRWLFLVEFSKVRKTKINYSKYTLAQPINDTVSPKQNFHNIHSVLKGETINPSESKYDQMTKNLNKQRSYLKRLEEIKQQKSKEKPFSITDYLSEIPANAIWTTALSALILLIASLIYFYYNNAFAFINSSYIGIDKSDSSNSPGIANIITSSINSTSLTKSISSSTILGVSSTIQSSSSQTTKPSSISSTSNNEIELNLYNKNGDDINIIELSIEEVSKSPFSVNVDKIHRLPSSYIPIDLIPTDLPGGGMLKREATNLLRKLFEEANANGIQLKIASAYRSYEDQVKLFKYYVEQEINAGAITENDAINKANIYSAKPGHSEHQLGTTVDIICISCDGFTFSAENEKVWKFVEENGPKYGFKVSYPQNNLFGYQYEPWHIRYYGL